MPVRRAIAEQDGVYFITITCARWLPLFKLVDAYDVVYNWFDYLKKEGHYIISYVIMPDHLHPALLRVSAALSGDIIKSRLSLGSLIG